MKILIFMTVALLIGGLLPLQGAINSQLGRALNHPLQASFISFLGGLLAILALLLVLRPELPRAELLRGQPWFLFVGGLIGASYVTMVLTLAPKIGIANTLTASIAGTLVVSMAFDHFGLFGLPVHPVNLMRAAGGLGMLISLVLIQRA